MTNIPAAPPPVAFLDNLHAPDVFADSASGWFIFNGNMRITFEAVRVSHVSTPGPLSRVVLGRLVMPIGQVEAMARGLLEMIEKQKAEVAAPESVQGTPTLN